MKKIYTYNVKPGYRNLTVADIKANKGVKKLTQVNAKNAEEAYAAGIANIDMLICDSNNVEKVCWRMERWERTRSRNRHFT